MLKFTNAYLPGYPCKVDSTCSCGYALNPFAFWNVIEKNDPAIPFTEMLSCPALIQSSASSLFFTLAALSNGAIGDVWRKTVVAMLPDVTVPLPVVIAVPLAVADSVNCVEFGVDLTKYC